MVSYFRKLYRIIFLLLFQRVPTILQSNNCAVFLKKIHYSKDNVKVKYIKAKEFGMTGPLSGYRIIDMTSVVSGPLCTMMLGDQGADVIKIENPDGGDFTRAMSDRRGGLSAPFINNNRSKRSVAVLSLIHI